VSRTINDYIILYWNDIKNYGMTGDIDMGSNYIMKLYPPSSIEPLHPFAAFHNRAGIFDIIGSQKESQLSFHSCRSHSGLWQ